MSLRQRHHGALAQHGLDVELGTDVDRRPDQPDVEHSGGERPQLLNRRSLAQLDLHTGVRRPEALHRARDNRQKRRADEAHSEPSGLSGVEPARGRHGAIELRQQSPGVPEERRARRRQLNAAPGADEEAKSQLLLEPLDLLAQRGLGDVQPCGGPAEVQLLSDRDEVAQLAKLHDS